MPVLPDWYGCLRGVGIVEDAPSLSAQLLGPAAIRSLIATFPVTGVDGKEGNLGQSERGSRWGAKTRVNLASSRRPAWPVLRRAC